MESDRDVSSNVRQVPMLKNQTRIIRIAREIREIEKNQDPSIAVFHKDGDLRSIRALVVGPPETPFQFGYFEFLIQFPEAYPSAPPTVTCLTTNRGQTRFSPNIYANGRVCLSILGTWVGDKNEKWSPAQGVDSVLHSIQSLMSPNPFINEPSFEDNTETDKHKAYSDKIKHETVRISVLQTLAKGFEREKVSREDHFGVRDHDDLSDSTTSELSEVGLTDTEQQALEFCRRLFLWYYDFYLDTIDRESKSHEDHKLFNIAEFEGRDSNQMAGVYQYTTVRANLIHMKSIIDTKIAQWKIEGVDAAEREMRTSEHVVADFKNIINKYSVNEKHQLDISLPDIRNPFVWHLVIYSNPDSLLEGSVITVRVIISQSFPQDQPHVQVITPIFHYRISQDRTLAYMVQGDRNKLEDHISSIVKAVTESYPATEQRLCANVEASKLLWGSEELKIIANHKDYRTKVRRSAQRCLEEQQDDCYLTASSTVTPAVSETSPMSSVALPLRPRYVNSLSG